jgi:hypothetical protein
MTDKPKVKLTRVVDLEPPTKETYEEALRRHLEEASPDYKKSVPIIAMVMAITTDGLLYHVLTENSTLEILGSIEALKAAMLLEEM